MSLEMRTAYWDDRESKDAFQRFILEIHNLDFTSWEEAGYWDDDYRPFTIFQDGEVLSSVCMYSLPAVIDGRSTRVAQISGVGTLPEYRRCGLNRELTAAGLQWAAPDHEGVFLFSDDDAMPYYAHCGFQAMDEHIPTAEIIPVSRRRGAVMLDAGDAADREKIYRYAGCTAPVSNRFTAGSPKLFMFHALYNFRNRIWHIPEPDCLVCFRREGDTLAIYDVLGESIPTLDQVYSYISEESDRRVEFHFHSDRFAPDASGRRELIGNNLFVKPGFPIKEPVFPYSSRA